MDKELETYYNTYFDFFGTNGWKQLIEELKTNAININSVEAVKDEADMYFRKGQLNILANLLNFQTMIEHGYEEATKEDD